MKAADGGVDGSRAEKAACVLQRVDDSGMSATREQDQAARSVKDQRLIVGNGVFDPGVSGVDLSARRIIFFRIDARDRAGEPDAGKKFLGFFVHDKDAAGGLELSFYLEHGVRIVPAALEENAVG